MDHCCGAEHSSALQLPPGFRFHPTDDELVTHYLCRRCAGLPLFAPVIADVDLYKFDPWQLPEKALPLGGDQQQAKEWYFFSPRDRKYPNGSRPNRAAGTGYWKATGADKPVGSPRTVAIKKALVFYAGKPPKGVKTNWIMHEYRLADVDRSAAARKRTNNALRLDDWVLCRIYNKKGVIERYDTVADDDDDAVLAAAGGGDDVKPGAAKKAAKASGNGNGNGNGAAPMKVETHDFGYYDDYDMDDTPASAEMLCFDRPFPSPPSGDDRDADSNSNNNDYSTVVPRLQLPPHAVATTDNSNSNSHSHSHSHSSSGSEHVLSPSPDLPDRDHAESQPPLGLGAGWFDGVVDWGGVGAFADDVDGFVVDGGAALFGMPSPGAGLFPTAAALGDMFAYLQRPPF